MVGFGIGSNRTCWTPEGPSDTLRTTQESTYFFRKFRHIGKPVEFIQFFDRDVFFSLWTWPIRVHVRDLGKFSSLNFSLKNALYDVIVCAWYFNWEIICFCFETISVISESRCCSSNNQPYSNSEKLIILGTCLVLGNLLSREKLRDRKSVWAIFLPFL